MGNCWDCKKFRIEEYFCCLTDDDGNDQYDTVFICDKETEESEYLQFPYDKDMECFEE